MSARLSGRAKGTRGSVSVTVNRHEELSDRSAPYADFGHGSLFEAAPGAAGFSGTAESPTNFHFKSFLINMHHTFKPFLINMHHSITYRELALTVKMYMSLSSLKRCRCASRIAITCTTAHGAHPAVRGRRILDRISVDPGSAWIRRGGIVGSCILYIHRTYVSLFTDTRISPTVVRTERRLA